MVRVFKRSISTLTLILLSVGVVLVLGGGGYVAARLGGFGRQSAATDVDLQKGLVGWWKMDGNMTDATPNSGNGVLSGSPAPSLTTDRKGKANSAYSFDGTSSVATINPAAVLRPTAGLTVSMWLNTSNIGSSSSQKFLSTTEAGGYSLFATGSSPNVCGANLFSAAIYIAGAYQVVCVSKSLITDGVWALVTMTYNGSSMVLYINGVSVGTTTTSGAIGYTYSTIPVCLGAEASGVTCTTEFYAGKQDDVRIYNRGLTATEVTALYNSYGAGINTAKGEQGLVGWWPLDGNARDYSPYAHNGTVNGATLTTDREGKANSAYSFNGTSNYISIPDFDISTYISESAWVYPTASSQTTKILGKHSGGADVQGTLGTNTGYAWFEINTGGVYRSVMAPSPLAVNSWSLITATYDGTNAKLYVNGALVTTIAATGAIANNNLSWGIASIQGGGFSAGFAGSIDDVRIYNRALAASEVSAIYNSYNSQVGISNLQKGLVANWPFNGNKNDATPFARVLTAVNSPTLTTDRKGRANSAYQFNGTADRFTSPASTLPTQTITVSAWVRQTGWGNWYDLVVNNWCAEGGWELLTDTSGAVVFGLSKNAGSCVQYNAQCPAATMTLNTWKHLVGTYDGTTVKLYVDGSLCAITNSGNPGQTLITSGNLVFGEYSAMTTHQMDDVRIWNRALSATEVAQLYNLYN